MTTILPIRPHVSAGFAGHVIAVASGKGGVGKTWLSITLAHTLAMRGARVLLFDGDCGLANIDIQLGLTPACDLADVAAGRVPPADAITCYTGPSGTDAGFGILPGRSGAAVLSGLPVATLDAMLSELRELPAYDTLLLDLGAGIGRVTRRLAAWADTLLVVTTDEPTALTDAYAVLKLHARDRQVLADAVGPASDARVVVNQAASVGGGERAYSILAKACGNFLGTTPTLAGIIRKDQSVGDAIRRQVPVTTRHPNASSVRDVGRIADALRQQ